MSPPRDDVGAFGPHTRAHASRYKIGEEEMALAGASIADGAVCRIAIRDST